MFSSGESKEERLDEKQAIITFRKAKTIEITYKEIDYIPYTCRLRLQQHSFLNILRMRIRRFRFLLLTPARRSRCSAFTGDRRRRHQRKCRGRLPCPPGISIGHSKDNYGAPKDRGLISRTGFRMPASIFPLRLKRLHDASFLHCGF